MASDAENKAAIKALGEMIQAAAAKNLWMHCSYQDLWFSPSELTEENEKGRFLWGPQNWSIRDPNEHLQRLKQVRDNMQKSIDEFIDRMAAR